MSFETSAIRSAGWQARLELEIASSGSGSRITRRKHEGPFCVQRAFYPEGEDVAHVYVLHPPGGLVSGDRLELRVTVRERAAALVTTPAAQKLYRSDGRPSRQSVDLLIEPSASLEWLPGENIAFQGTLAETETRVEVARGGTFSGWELACLGRPAAGEGFDSGRLKSAFRLSRGGEPLVVERFELEGGSALLREPWGLSNFPVFGNLYCVARDDRDLTSLAGRVRERLSGQHDDRFAVSAIESVLLVRVAAASAERARTLLAAAWEACRPELLGRPAVAPRVWNT